MSEMSITEVFDRAKKRLDGGSLEDGYVVDGRKFSLYYTNREWEEFKEKMPLPARKRFDDGKGSEMQEYTRRGITYPPKMASYASSSRFMYGLGRQIDGLVYEEQLETGLGGYPANIDGYLESKGIYVEAKCHELYGYSRPEVHPGHIKLLDGIVPVLDGRLQYSTPNGYLYLSWDGKDSGHFDLKQMLCHLSGIANKVLGGGDRTVHFIYLVYRPTDELLRLVEKESDRKKIGELYAAEKAYAQGEMFQRLYGAILRYFNKEKAYGYSEASIQEMIASFDFTFCDQKDFLEVVKAL